MRLNHLPCVLFGVEAAEAVPALAMSIKVLQSYCPIALSSMKSLSAALLFLLPVVLAEETASDAAIVELRATIAKIVDAEVLASKESADWQGRKAQMAALLELQQRELKLLNEELAEAGASAGSFDERKREAEADLAELKEVRRAVKQVVAEAQPRMIALVQSMPEPLLKEMELERISLESWTAEDEARGGLQAILGIVAKAEQFNRRITRSVEERDGREVQVIYLGLARAYYADRSGNAGLGDPGPDGWKWQSKPEIAGEVRSALDQLDRKRPPEVVELPVQIKEVAR